MSDLASVERTDSGPVVRWKLRREPALTPLQLVASVAVVVMAGAVITLMFWGLGHGVAAGLMLLTLGVVVGAAFRYVRHACDHESLVVHNGRLVVEQCRASVTRRTEFKAPIVSVEPGPENTALLCVAERGFLLRLGGSVDAETRRRVTAEVQRVLHSR